MAQWVLDYYQGEDGYSDGQVETELLTWIKNGENLDEALMNDNRWAVFYHLSHLRRNVFNWYPFKSDGTLLEIGAGCGALTGLFCERVASVTAVELTKTRSEINYERNKAYPNLEIVTGNFHNISFEKKYDYIVLNGVLEYAGSFSDGEDPYATFLEQIKPLLSDRGILLISIENRLGLKYFNGVVEDHTSALFSGLNHYEGIDSMKTFSKQELTGLLQKCHFDDMRFYYPYPDYKFPEIIYTDETLGMLEKWQYPVYNKKRLSFFDEDAMADTLNKEGILDRFCNSYIVEAGIQPLDDENDRVLYAKLSNKRRKPFRLMTRILERGGKKVVEKKALLEEGSAHIEHMIDYGKYDLALPSFSNLTCENNGAGTAVMPFLETGTLESRLIQLLKQGKIDGFEAIVQRFIKSFFVGATQQDYGKQSAFTEVFGDARIDDALECKKDINIDYIFSNIFLKAEDGQYDIIDYEWWFDFYIPVKFVVWRSLYYLYLNNGIVQEKIGLDKLFGYVGITDEEHEVFASWDEHFGNQYVGGGLLTQQYERKTYYPTEMLNRILDDHEYVAELFIDRGQGISENEKLRLPVETKNGRFTMTYAIENEKSNIVGFRWDPGDFPCRIKDLEIKVDGRQVEDMDVNGYWNKQDKNMYLFDRDPQVHFPAMPDVHRVEISGELHNLLPWDELQNMEQYLLQIKARANKRRDELDLEMAILNQKLAESRRMNEILKQQLATVTESTSWRMTKPLRSIMDKVHKNENE